MNHPFLSLNCGRVGWPIRFAGDAEKPEMRLGVRVPAAVSDHPLGQNPLNFEHGADAERLCASVELDNDVMLVEQCQDGQPVGREHKNFVEPPGNPAAAIGSLAAAFSFDIRDFRLRFPDREATLLFPAVDDDAVLLLISRHRAKNDDFGAFGIDRVVPDQEAEGVEIGPIFWVDVVEFGAES